MCGVQTSNKFLRALVKLTGVCNLIITPSDKTKTSCKNVDSLYIYCRHCEDDKTRLSLTSYNRNAIASTADEYDVYEHKTSRLQSFGGRMIQQGLYGGRHGELA